MHMYVLSCICEAMHKVLISVYYDNTHYMAYFRLNFSATKKSDIILLFDIIFQSKIHLFIT